MTFDRFGRSMGAQLLLTGSRIGLDCLLHPVSIVRYFEFEFALSCLPQVLGHCLDVSSPRLFSLYVASKMAPASVTMINPDAEDISRSMKIASKLGLRKIRGECSGVESLSHYDDTYDIIWSISVIEHISGDHDDRHAMKHMYDSLNSGGRLILTVPVDRKFWNEYRDRTYYGTQPEQNVQSRFFFQRFYDRAAISERLLEPLGITPSSVRWFGESTPGRFSQYIGRWIHEGYNCTVEDPREIADHYREYSSWEEMPGMGVCGLMVEKNCDRSLENQDKNRGGGA